MNSQPNLLAEPPDERIGEVEVAAAAICQGLLHGVVVSIEQACNAICLQPDHDQRTFGTAVRSALRTTAWRMSCNVIPFAGGGRQPFNARMSPVAASMWTLPSACSTNVTRSPDFKPRFSRTFLGTVNRLLLVIVDVGIAIPFKKSFAARSF
jgi:hypothetical protein